MQAKLIPDPSGPTAKFRRASWLALQLHLDPLATPRPLPRAAALDAR